MSQRIPWHEPNLDPPERQLPKCPVCGEECSSVFIDVMGKLVGCETCLAEYDSESYLLEEDY